MARTRATIHTDIWSPNSDFRALNARAQRMFFVLLSQGDLSLCGVCSISVSRWARLATDTTPVLVRRALQDLQDANYIVVDEETEELWIRTFTKHDGVLRQPNVIVAMSRDFDSIQSLAIRDAFIDGLPDTLLDGSADGSVHGLPEGYRQRLSPSFLAWVLRARTRAPTPTPTPTPRVDPSPPRGHQIPSDFVVTDSMKDWASNHNISSDINRETEKFVDHFTAKGEAKRDWVAAWRNWMRRADEGWGAKPKHKTAPVVSIGATPLNHDDDDEGERIYLPGETR